MKTLYAARFARVTENLARQGLTQMIVSDPSTIFYLTGVRIQPGERMLALLLRADGNHRFFVNALFGTPEAGIPVERGKIRTKSTGTFENMPGVFAGGDCASGPASVITAIAAGKVVAANIDEYLGYHHEISCDVDIPEPDLTDRSPCGRVNLTEREACLRVKDFEGVENCMTENEAKQEAGRCLRCDHFGYGIFKGGRETIW